MKIMIKKEQIDKIDELQKQVNELAYKLANERNAVITLQENANANRLKVGEVMKQNSELQKQVDELLNRRIEPNESIEPVNEACRMCMNALKELSELKDKIESGTLVEENKFYIKKSYRNHDDQRYRIVEFIENECYDGLTLEQAEARLKELQEERK